MQLISSLYAVMPDWWIIIRNCSYQEKSSRFYKGVDPTFFVFNFRVEYSGNTASEEETTRSTDTNKNKIVSNFDAKISVCHI